jgi:type IV secretion system protein VirB10
VAPDTEILLQLKNVIDTRSAHVGDGVYCQTTFPVVVDNVIVIPAGTYVKGEIAKVQRAGRISGRAEILFHFNTVIFPTGYTVEMPGNLHGDSGSPGAKVADDEGTVKTTGHDKLKQIPDVGRDAGIGALGGGLATGTLNGARVGAGLGAVAGLATMMLTRGSDVRIEPGAALTMRLQRPLVVDVTSATTQAQTQVIPRDTSHRLPIPPPVSKPQ